MNKSFRIVWSAARNAFIVTHEKANSHGKPSSTRKATATALMAALLGTSGFVLAAPPVNTLPTNGQIVGGAAAGNIATNGNAMTVTQNQQRMVANWDSYSIGSNASVHYQQPAGGVALNRVTGTAPSEIFGKLSATGSVFLINPNGVMFGASAQVNVGSLVATTMKMNDSDFMAGTYKFTGGNGSVINLGNLTAEQGGYIALLAPEVRNEGIITASMGSVLLAGAEAVTLSHDSSGLQYAVDKGAVKALVENKHLIQADGGQVILTARAANQLAGSVINNSGTIEAKGLVAKGGKIMLEADHITLASGSTLDASGQTGGGTVLVGGDWQGSGTMQQAVTVNMENGAKIDVSAKAQGDGGKAVLWSDVHNANSVTKVNGEILAKGGSESGDGGKVETSGHKLTIGDNGKVSTSGAKSGLWLLDPFDFTIGTDITGANLQTALGLGNVSITTTNTAATCTGATCSAGTSANGDIIFNDAVSWSTNTLTLSAYRNIAVNSTLGISGDAGLTLTTNTGNATGKDIGYLKMQQGSSSFGGKINWTSTGALTMNGNAYSKVSTQAELAAVTGSGKYFLANDIALTGTWAPITGYSGIFDGLGHTLGNLSNGASTSADQGLFGTITGATIQNIGITSGTLSGGNNVGAFVGSATSGTNHLRNLFTTSSVTISPDGTAQRSNIGGIIGNSTTTLNIVNTNNGANINGPTDATSNLTKVGGLVGHSTGALAIKSSTNSGTIIGGKDTASTLGDNVGGLVGHIEGGSLDIANFEADAISNSGNIYGSSYIGGIIGRWSPTGVGTSAAYVINRGNVFGDSTVGGIAGVAAGAANSTIDKTANLGNVTGGGMVGGLFGNLSPSAGMYVDMLYSYNQGAVLAKTYERAGGLIGYLAINNAAFSGAYLYNSGSVTNDPAGNTSNSNVGGFFGSANLFSGADSTKMIRTENSYSSGTLTGGSYVGGVAGRIYFDSNGSYTGDKTYILQNSVNGGTTIYGQTVNGSGSSLATSQTAAFIQTTSNYDNGRFSVQAGVNGGFPVLTNFKPVTPVTINVNALSKIYGDANPTLTGQYSITGCSSCITLDWGSFLTLDTGFGTYAYSTSNLLNLTYVSGSAGSYSLSWGVNNFTVDKKALTITAPTVTKTYDGTTSATGTSTYNVALANNDSVLTTPTLTFDNRNFGTNKTVTPSAVVIKDGSTDVTANYDITWTANTASAINKLDLTVTAPDLTKTYDGTLTATGSPTFGALGSGDSVGTAASLAFLDKNYGVDNKTVRASGLLINDGNGGANYAISYVDNTTSTIDKASLTLTTSNVTKTYDNTTNAAGSATVSGGTLFSGDTLSGGSFAFTNEHFGLGNKTVTVGSVTVNDGNSGNNYNVSYANNTTSTINKASIVFTTSDVTKTYDGLLTAAGITTISSGTLFSGDTISGGSFAFTNKNYGVGNKTVTTNGVTVNDGNSGLNYSVTYANNTTSTINQLALTVTAPDLTKTYDGGLTQGDATGSAGVGSLVAGDSVNVAATLAYLDKNYGVNNKTVRASALTIKDGASADMTGNYAITYVDNTTSGINKANLTLAPVTGTKVYDGTLTSAATVTVTGKAASDTVTVNEEYQSKNVLGTNASTLQIKSGYTIVDGSAADMSGNYNITANGTATGTITARPVTVTAAAQTKVYGDADPSLTFTTNAQSGGVGLITGENLAGSLIRATGEPVASYAIGQGTVTNGNNSNYAISYTGANLTISQRPITLLATSATKIYGESDPTLAVSITGGSLGSQTVSDILADVTGTLSREAGSNVGSYNILLGSGGTAGSKASNYAITYNSANSAFSITQRPINITADGQSKVYGNADPSLTYAVEANSSGRGLFGTDTFAGGLTRSAGETVAGGPYAITQGTLANGNYLISFTGNNLGITQRPITLTASAASKIYGESDPSLAVTVTGGSLATVAQSDALVTVSGALSRQAGSNVGDYDIALGAGSKADNYAITFATDNNAFTINRRPVNVTADAKNKEYGSADPTLTFVAESQSSGRGMLGSETLSGALTRVAGETVLGGPYAIQQGGVTNAANGNYAISYTGSNLTINTKTLTLAGNTGVTKTYDGTTAMPVGNYGYGSLVGIVGSDTVTVSGAPVYDSANANSVRSVLIGNVGIAGSDASNYTMSWSNGSGTINKAPLSVTANADAKFVTQGDVLTTYNGVSYNGFVHGENTGALNITGLSVDRNNPGQNNAGTYSGVLVPSGVTAGNYQISYVNGDYTIVPANQLLVRVQNTSTTYGTGPSYTITDARYMDGSNVIHTLAAPTISGNTVTYSDGVGGSATFTLGPVAAQNSTANQLKAGGYSIGASNITESSANFSNTLTLTGALTVDKKALSANATNVSKVYDASTAMNNVVLGYTGLETSDVVTISGNGNFSDKNVGTNKAYTVSSLTLGSTDAANYFLSGGTSLSGSNGEVTKKIVSLSGARTYDGTRNLGNGTVTITTGVGSETLTYSGATAHSKNVGSNYIDAITLGDEAGATSTSGGLASNYQLPGMTASSSGNSVSFTQKALSILGITAADKTYDGNQVAAVNTNNAAYSGLVGGDQLSVATTGLFDTKNAGSNKTVALTSTYSGSDVGNYAITGQPTTTATVSRKSLTISGATAADKTYDGTTDATLTLGSLLGLIGGEALGLSGIGNFDDPNVGIGKAVAVKLALANGANGLAGNYSITDTRTTANINPVPNVVPPLPTPFPPGPPPPPEVPPMPDSGSSSGSSSSSGGSTSSGSSSGGDTSSSSGSSSGGSTSSGSSSGGADTGSSSGSTSSGSSSGGDTSSSSGSSSGSSTSSGSSSSGADTGSSSGSTSSGSSSGGDTSSSSGSSSGSSTSSGSSSGGDTSSSSGSSSGGSTSSGSSSGGADTGSSSGSSSSSGGSTSSGSSSGGDTSSSSGSSSSGGSTSSGSSSGADTGSSSGSTSSGSSSGGDTSSSSGSSSGSSTSSGSSSGGDTSSSSGSSSGGSTSSGSSSGGADTGSSSGSSSSSGGSTSSGSSSGGDTSSSSGSSSSGGSTSSGSSSGADTGSSSGSTSSGSSSGGDTSSSSGSSSGGSTSSGSSSGGTDTGSRLSSSSSGGSTSSSSSSGGTEDSPSSPNGPGGSPVQFALLSTGESAAPKSSSSSTAAGESGTNGFISVRNFDTLEIPAGSLFSFTLPKDTFKHADPKVSVAMEARGENGPLPAWLIFEPGTGKFTGRPPESLASFTVIVTARDSTGNEISTKVVLKFSGKSKR